MSGVAVDDGAHDAAQRSGVEVAADAIERELGEADEVHGGLAGLRQGAARADAGQDRQDVAGRRRRGERRVDDLVVPRSEQEREPRDLDDYLELAGCEGDERRRAESLAPRGYAAELGWYLLERR